MAFVTSATIRCVTYHGHCCHWCPGTRQKSASAAASPSIVTLSLPLVFEALYGRSSTSLSASIILIQMSIEPAFFSPIARPFSNGDICSYCSRIYERGTYTIPVDQQNMEVEHWNVLCFTCHPDAELQCTGTQARLCHRPPKLFVKSVFFPGIYSQFGLAIHQNDHQARRRFVEWAQNEIAVVPDFHKRILFSDEAHFWLNGYFNKQNCRIWSEANPQVYVETPLHPEKLTVWCALWAGGIFLQKR
ncbi:hypothetical protein TNCV_4247821 [Trichonephila clavipes]|nr:hypothetical protein TNCV_4247821 [Trichonephila clavipes]